MVRKVEDPAVGLDVPDLQGLVFTGRGKPLFLGAECHRPNHAGVTCEGTGFLAGGRVPDLHGPVRASRRKAGTVPVERHASDTTGVSSVFAGCVTDRAPAAEGDITGVAGE